jgi:hypothetical protein
MLRNFEQLKIAKRLKILKMKYWTFLFWINEISL